MIGIEFIGYNNDHVLKPNIDWMISELEKHVSSTAPENTNDSHWGISAIEKLRDFFVDEIVNNNRIYIDTRYSKVLYEHEWILTRIIDIFLDDSEKDKYLIYAKANLNRANLIHMIGLKMEITGNENLLNKVVNYMNEIIDSIDEIVYYAPEFRSSPPYITEPTANAGIPTIVYECYSFEAMDLTLALAEKLIDAVEGLSFD